MQTMNLEERIKSFAAIGETLRNSLNGSSVHSVGIGRDLSLLIDNQYKLNPWFTPENVRKAVKAIACELTKENLIKWTNCYPELKGQINPVRVGVIMAGNI